MELRTYPLYDQPSTRDLINLGFPLFCPAKVRKLQRAHVRAVSLGVYKAPNAGEWYLSGAIPEAYKAHRDMSGACCMAGLVVQQ